MPNSSGKHVYTLNLHSAELFALTPSIKFKQYQQRFIRNIFYVLKFTHCKTAAKLSGLNSIEFVITLCMKLFCNCPGLFHWRETSLDVLSFCCCFKMTENSVSWLCRTKYYNLRRLRSDLLNPKFGSQKSTLL